MCLVCGWFHFRCCLLAQCFCIYYHVIHDGFPACLTLFMVCDLIFIHAAFGWTGKVRSFCICGHYFYYSLLQMCFRIYFCWWRSFSCFYLCNLLFLTFNFPSQSIFHPFVFHFHLKWEQKKRVNHFKWNSEFALPHSQLIYAFEYHWLCKASISQMKSERKCCSAIDVVVIITIFSMQERAHWSRRRFTFTFVNQFSLP